MEHEEVDQVEETRSQRRTMLHNLFSTGNKDELIRQGQRFLETDPEDPGVHYYLCLVTTDQEKFKQANYHLEQVRRGDPNSWEGFYAALQYHLGRDKPKDASREAKVALERFPEEGLFHYLAGVAAARGFRVEEAKKHSRRARELRPDHAGIINFDLMLRGTEEERADQAWDRIHEYEEALASDPEDAGLWEGMGDVYLDDIDDHENAERCYRQALLLNPTDRDLQRLLFRAVAKRRLLYRFLSIPSRVWSWSRDVCLGLRQEPWRIIFLLVFIKGWLCFLGWLICMTLLLWPPCKFYEWMLVSQLRDSGAPDAEVRLWTRFQRLPAWLRFGMFMGLIGAFWWALMYLFDIEPDYGFKMIGFVAAFHWVLTALVFYLRKFRAWSGRRKAGNRRKKAGQPPPFPSS